MTVETEPPVPRDPRRLTWDNETGIGRRNSWAAGVAAFAGVLATRIVQVKPYDRESKGVVERSNKASMSLRNGDSCHRSLSHGATPAPDT